MDHFCTRAIWTTLVGRDFNFLGGGVWAEIGELFGQPARFDVRHCQDDKQRRSVLMTFLTRLSRSPKSESLSLQPSTTSATDERNPS